MATNPSVYDVPRARPVAELPLDILLERSDEMAKRWAVALIRVRPVATIGEIPLAQLAVDAPALFAAALRAMHSDAELGPLAGTDDAAAQGGRAPAFALATAAGARDANAIVEAVEAMRGVLWEAMLDELRDPPARYVADLADRLSYVCARTLAAAISAGGSEQARSPMPDETKAGLGEARHRPVGSRPSTPDAVIVDERATGSAPQSATTSAPEAPKQDADQARDRPAPSAIVDPSVQLDVHRPAAERPLSWDESPPVPPAKSVPTIEIRDERTETGPAAWIGSIGRQLAQYGEDGRPFAVLLVELLEMESIRRTESPTELARLDGLTEEALAREVRTRGSGSLTRECPGRYWLLACDTDRPGANMFAQRVKQAVASAVSYQQSPLDVVVGAAVCPEDGGEAPELAAQADVELYAARSAATRTVPSNGNGSKGASNGRRSSLLASFRSTREGGGR